MNLSVMLFPFHSRLSDGTLSATHVIEEFQAQGVKAIEPMMSWVEAEPEKWSEFDRAARDAGMVYSCYDVGVNFVGESEADRVQAQDTVVRGVDFCREKLNCPIVLLPGTKAASGMSDEDGRQIYGEGLAKAAERTQGSGVTLTIEDFGVYPTFAASAKHCLEVLEASNCPAIKFTFDNGNFLLADDLPTDAYALTKDRTAHVHIKDFALRDPDDKPGLTSPGGTQYKGCLIGDGKAQVTECVALLKADQYDGWVSLEVGGGGDPLDEAIHGAKVVTEAWQSK